MLKKLPILLVAIFLLAYFLRVYYLPQGALSFYYDQARDAFIVDQLLSGDIKIQGPPASLPGLFHGVFYYYIIAPGYLLGGGSPIAAAYWLALLHALTVFVIYFFVMKLTGDKISAYFSSFIFAISFESTQYATWLSNPSIAILTLPLGYFGLWLWLKEKNKWGPYVAALGLGLSVQAEFFLAYHMVPFGIWLLVKKKEIKRNNFVAFVATFLVSISTMIVAQLKFGTGTLGGILNLFTAEDILLRSRNLGDFIVLYLNQLGNTFSNSVFPTNPGWGGAFGVVLLIIALNSWAKKKGKDLMSWQPFIATFILAHLSVVSLGGVSTPFIAIGIGVAAIILVGIMLGGYWKKHKVLVTILLLAIVLSNLSQIFSKNKNGQTLLAIQEDLVISKELQAIDYTYQESGGEEFSINTITNPLWTNTTWSYLYNWYGLKNYGYLPRWTGRDQIGLLGNNLDKTDVVDPHYYIIEPTVAIPGKFLEETLADENSRSSIIETSMFGEIEVQKRVPLED